MAEAPPLPDSPATPDHAGVRVMPPLVWFACVLVSLIADFWYPLSYELGVAARVVGIACGIAGIGLMSWSAGLIVRQGSHIPPNKPTKTLVFDGPYRFSRNPIYVAFFFSYAAMSLLFDSMWFALPALPLWWFLRHQVIAREEAYLERKFGKEYQDYKTQVRRWI